MRLQNITSTFAILATASITAAQNITTPSNSTLNFNCSTLTDPFANYTLPYETPVRVSTAVICPNDASERDMRCRLVANLSMKVNATTNTTNIPSPMLLNSTLFRTLQARGATRSNLTAINFSLKTLAYHNQSAVLYAKPGQAAYIAFKPIKRCYSGILRTSDMCEQLDEGVTRVKQVFDGQRIDVCVPDMQWRFKNSAKPRRRREYYVASGDVEIVGISAEQARRIVEEDREREAREREERERIRGDMDEGQTGGVGRVGGSRGLIGMVILRMGVCWFL